jgi:hypothetical protein
MLGISETASGDVVAYDCIRSLEIPIQTARYGRTLPQREKYIEQTVLCLAPCNTGPLLDLIECARVGYWLGKDKSEQFDLRFSVSGSEGRGKRFEEGWEVHVDAPPCLANCLALPGDIDGDGIDDVIIGDSSFSIAGGILARSGANGSLLWRFASLQARIEQSGFKFPVSTGVSVDVLDDLDHDGVVEILAGCGSFYWNSGTCADGAVLILSGRTGKLVSRTMEADVPLLLR